MLYYKDINKTDKLESLNTKIYITNGDYVFKTGEFYEVVNGKIVIDSLVSNSTIKDKIPYQLSFTSDFELEFYFMPYEKRERIGKMLNIEPIGWSHEGIEYIDINFLAKLLKDFINEPNKGDEIFLKQIFNKL